jgi:hypothetical protein
LLLLTQHYKAILLRLHKGGLKNNEVPQAPIKFDFFVIIP